MSVTMPYRPYRSQSRVEFIKKKFENFTEDTEEAESQRFPKSNFLKELENLNLSKQVSAPGFRTNDVNKTEGKALVKRSPAFRREKLPCTKSSSQIQNSETFSRFESENAQNEVLKTDFKRSKTDTNLLKYCTNRNLDEKSALCQTKDNLDTQYSVVDKTKKNQGKSGAVNLKFTESIRRALESPLPKGPPPKKPPRTFSHVVSQPPPPKLKVDIPNLKSKLDKLEKVVKIHETGNTVKQTPNKPESSLMPDEKETNTYNSCLPITKCLSQSTKTQSLQKIPKAKSEFYLDVNSSKKEFLFVLPTNETSVKKSSCEAIYDLPCTNKKNSFETFGKNSKNLNESVNAKKAEGLHYMCTDVISQTPKCPNFMTNLQWRKSIEGETQFRVLDLKTNQALSTAEKQKSKSMSRIDDVKENVGQRKGFDETSSDFQLDSVSLSSSDWKDGRNKTGTEDEILAEMTAKRKIYVNRVSSKLISESPCWKYKNKNSYKRLFECCLLVGLTLCESKKNVPYIKSIYPPQTKPPPLIESLCFPDASYWPPTSENRHQPEDQYYSLVVTNENGERKFGYCRRVLPEGGHVCLPLTYCIISPHRAGGFFYKVLEELESRHGSSGVEDFIKQLYESEFPGPGERLKLKEILEEATRTSSLDSDLYFSSTLVRRPPDVRLEEKDLTQLFKHLELSVFLKVFSSLLHERKVLLLSNSLRNLSSCIEALQSILLPFSWQHTYIPVLPVHLIEMCEAPTPYVIGLLKPRNVEKSLTNVNFEDGIMVDLDESKILKCCGDESGILPSRFIRNLKTALGLAMNTTDMLSESVRSVLISDAFIRFFVHVCGNYSIFIQNLPNGERIFQKEEFIKSVASNTTQSFLEWFTETAMFNCFIQERLQGDYEDVLVQLFRRRAMEYSEESLKDSAALLKNYRFINKKVKTLGDKIKDLTSFSK